MNTHQLPKEVDGTTLLDLIERACCATKFAFRDLDKDFSLFKGNLGIEEDLGYRAEKEIRPHSVLGVEFLGIKANGFYSSLACKARVGNINLEEVDIYHSEFRPVYESLISKIAELARA